MLGKITALLLAILVANPFCCCFAAEAAVADEAHSCCPVAMAAMEAMERADASAPAESSESEPCDCPDERRGEWATVAVEKPMAPQWTLLAEVAWELLPEIEAYSGGYLHGASDLPDAVKPPGRAFLQAHCRYLL